MATSIRFLFFLACIFSSVSAYTLRGRLIDPTNADTINGRVPITFKPSTSIHLQSSAVSHATLLKSDKTSFTFLNVSEGSYLLSVNSIEQVFPNLRVDVKPGAVEVFITYRGNEWDVKGARQPYPIELKPIHPAVYYQFREGFNVFKLFKNPMLLLSLFSLLMVFVLPKIKDSIDPEELAKIQQEQLKKAQSRSQATQSVPNPLNFDVASYLAGRSEGAGSTSSSATIEQPARSRKA
ncbi:hypothetical protein V1514DRAFT_327959 [Lipomyces japonicus]|uniref:uncharacterized protein n=1 Tax=Lipomyces japonicus TaxID=56871 RepID=UPI0034CDDFAC